MNNTVKTKAAFLMAALTVAQPLLATAQTYELKVPAKTLVVQSAGVLATSASQLTFADTSVGQSSAAQAVTVSNTGTEALSFNGVPSVTGPYALSTNCSSVLAGGASCVVSVEFIPTGAGLYSSNVTIATSAGTAQVPLHGTGLSEQAVVGSNSIDFGDQAVGTTSGARTVSLTNTGNEVVSLSAISTSGPYFATFNCPSSLAVGASCQANVTFSPTAMGSAPGTLLFTTAAGNKSISLSGNGVQAGAALSAQNVSFGNVVVGASSAAKTLTVTNTGNLELSLSPATLSAPFVSTTNCASTLSAGASCSYTLSFSPSAMGAASSTFSLPTSAGTQTAALSGMGSLTAGSVAVSSVDFGSLAVGSASIATPVTLNNTGNTPLTLGAITTTGAFAAAQNCPTTLAVSASCTVNVTFVPNAMGPLTGSLTLVTGTGNQVVSLTGTGLQTSAALSAGTLNYAALAVGATSPAQTVTLSNTGNTALSVSAFTSTAPFSATSTCGATLAAGSSCTYSVTVTPSAEGSASGLLTVATNGGTQSVSLSATGLQAIASLSTNNLVFASLTVGATSAAQLVNLTNTGNSALTLSAPTVALPFALSSSTCGSTLAAGATCGYAVTFSPTGVGGSTASMTLSTSEGAQTVTLSGTGIAPSGLESGSVDFGSQALYSTSAPSAVTLTNTGTLPLGVSGVTTSGAFSAAHNCPDSLAVGSSCTANVTFTPSVMGATSGTVTFATDAGNQAVVLTGFGLQSSASLSTQTLTLAAVEVGSTSSAQSTVLSNTGNTALTISGARVDSPFYVSTTCGATLAAGTTCTYSVTVAPQALGAISGTLTITTSAGNLNASVSGSGLQVADATNVGSQDFGSQNVGTSSSPIAVTLNNTGNEAVGVTGVTTTGAFTAVHNCPTSLAVGSSCTANVTFTPSTMGAAAGTVTFSTQAGNKTVTLSGMGLQTSASVSLGSLTLAAAEVGTTSSAQVVTLNNTGNTPVTVSSASASAPFSASSICGTTLDAGASCAYSVSVTATAMGPISGTLSIPTSAGTKSVTLNGTGLQAADSTSASTSDFGNQNVGTTSAANSVTLSNTGNEAVTVSGVSTTGAFAASTNCPATLAAGANCSANVTFTPSTMGATSGLLTFATSAGNKTVTLTGVGSQTAASLSGSSLTLASTNVGSMSGAQSVTLNNTGNTVLSVSAASLSGTSSTAFAVSTSCATTLAVGASCTYSVTFSPSVGGLAVANLSIPTSAGIQSVVLSGTGLQAAAATNMGSLSFSGQAVGTTSAASPVTLNNTGNLPINVSGVGVSGAFGATHNCPATLAVGASCSANVTFGPTLSGATSGSLTFATSIGNVAVNLYGTGLQAVASLSTPALTLPTMTVGATSAVQYVVMNNSGNTDLALSPATVGAPFAVSTSCGATLSAGSSCSYGLTFTPVTFGPASATLTVPTSAGTQTASISATGQEAVDNISQGLVGFGTQVVNTPSAPQSVTLNNTGNLPVTVSAVTVAGPFAATQNCPATLDAGASCVANITFTPTAMGATSGTLTFATSAGNQIVTLSGYGQQTSSSISTSSLTMDSTLVGSTSAQKLVTLNNTGNTVLTVSAASISAPFAVTTNCGTTLAVGSACNYMVTFTPTGMGSASSSLVVTTDAGANTVAVSGVGLQAGASVDRSSLTFGNTVVGVTSAAQTVTLTNPGNSSLTVGAASVSGAYALSATTCSASLAGGASCTYSVTFTPTVMNSNTGTLTLPSAVGSTTVSLNGTGLLTAVSTVTPSLDFGSATQVGSSSTAQGVTLTNTGNQPVSLSVTINGAFTAPNNCPASLSAGASCTANVSFNPTTTGTATGYLQFVTGIGTQTVTLTGTGQQTSAAASPTTLTFTGTTVGTTSAAQVLTLSNSGTTALTYFGVSTTGPFATSGTSTCPTSGGTLAVGASCQVSIVFMPVITGVAGTAAQGGSVTFSTSAGSTVASTTGTAKLAWVDGAPTSISFGTIQSGQTTTSGVYTLTSDGDANATGFYLTLPTGYSFATNTCPTGGGTFNAGATCSFSVTFAPALVQSYNASLSAGWTGPNAASASIPLYATSVAAMSSVSASSLTFSSTVATTTSAAQVVTLKNTGVGPLTVGTPTATGNFTVANSCPASLAQSATCNISVTFAPLTAGTLTGTLSIPNAAGTSTVSLTGTAVAGVSFTSSASTYNYGAVQENTANQSTFTLTNNGTSLLSLTSSTVSPSTGYTASNNCTNIAVGNTCSVTVTFTPTTTSSYPATLTLTASGSGLVTSLPITLNGSGSVSPLGNGVSTAGACASGAASGCANWNTSPKGTNISLAGRTVNGSGYSAAAMANLGKSSGKWYWEITVNSAATMNVEVGVGNSSTSVNSALDYDGWVYYGYNGDFYSPGGAYAGGSAFNTAGTVIGVALDATTAGSPVLYFYKNGVYQFSKTLSTPTVLYPAVGDGTSANWSATGNFGATNFAYPVPSGFNAGVF